MAFVHAECDAQTSLLRITCSEITPKAEIAIDGVFKGECPLDVQVAPGSIALSAFNKVDETRIQYFNEEFRIGSGVAKKIEIDLGAPRFNPTVMKRATLALKQSIDAALPNAEPLPIAAAILPFGGDAAIWAPIVSIIKNDLEMGKQFRFAESGDAQSAADAKPDFAYWKNAGVRYVFTGAGELRPDGRIDMKIYIWDVAKGVSLGGRGSNALPVDSRLLAHRLANFIQEKATGKAGRFDRRIARVQLSPKRYTLLIEHIDGGDSQPAITSPKLLALPVWSPSGSHLVYVSFEQAMPAFYLQDMTSGKRAVSKYSDTLLAECATEILAASDESDESRTRWLNDNWSYQAPSRCAVSVFASMM